MKFGGSKTWLKHLRCGQLHTNNSAKLILYPIGLEKINRQENIDKLKENVITPRYFLTNEKRKILLNRLLLSTQFSRGLLNRFRSEILDYIDIITSLFEILSRRLHLNSQYRKNKKTILWYVSPSRRVVDALVAEMY